MGHSVQAQANAPKNTPPEGGAFQAQGTLPAVNLPTTSEPPGSPPSPDAGMDGFTWDGKNFKVTDLRIIDSKFSAYLNEPEVNFQEEKEYSEIIQRILEKLDVFAFRQKGRALLKEVLPELAKASRHPRDGGVCRQIYNAVGVDVQSKNSADDKQRRVKELEKEIDTIKWNMSVAAKPSSMDVHPKGGDSASYYQYEEAQREKKTRLAFMQNDLENKYAELMAVQNSIVSKTDDARFALQRLVVANFLSRRFDHVMITTSFYRLLYPDGASEVKMQERVIAQAAENVGFEGVLTPTGTGCDDSWVLRRRTPNAFGLPPVLTRLKPPRIKLDLDPEAFTPIRQPPGWPKKTVLPQCFPLLPRRLVPLPLPKLNLRASFPIP